MVTAPLAKYLCESYGVLRTFLYLGLAFTVIILAISRTLKVPPAGRVRALSTISEVRTTPSPKVPMIRSQRFYGLWLCYAIGTFVGLLAISISSPVAQEIIKLEPKTAAICVSLFAIFNGAGRPGFGWLTDRIQPKNAAITSYVMILMGSLLMLSASEGQTTTYLIGFSLFWLSLGAWLAIAPTATLTWFDPQQYAKNYGVVFTAYGVGALLGPIAASRLRDLFGSYIYAFYPTACLAVLGIIVAVFMLKRN